MIAIVNSQYLSAISLKKMLVPQFIAKILPQFIKLQVVSGRKKLVSPHYHNSQLVASYGKNWTISCDSNIALSLILIY